eukprot:s113_g29.t1
MARPSLEFTMDVFKEQSRHHRGYGLEQPYGSAMWSPGPFNPMDLESIPGNRKHQRVDQCMHGATDEGGNPVQKATGLGGNVKWNRTALRCSGHGGKLHSHLQGASGGVNRTAAAPVYPRQMCQRMRQDVVHFLHQRQLMAVPPWPKDMIYHTIQSYWECVRCQLGRSCPKDIPHRMIPKQCRRGKWAPGTADPKSKAAPSDPIKEWTKRAHCDMLVRGIMLELRPFCKSKADPQLVFDSSYLRLIIRGTIKDWIVGPMEDLREMSHNQIHEAIEEDNWMVTIYRQELDGVPAPSTPSSRPRRIPPQPALPPRQDDVLAEPQVLDRPAAEGEDRLVEAPYEAAEEFEVAPREEIQPIRPNYNLKMVLRRLPKLFEEENFTRCKQLLLGLHERLWHSPASDFTNLLRRAGLQGELIKLAEEAVKSCAVCRKYVRLPNRPQMRTGGANVFNETIQMDLFNWEDVWYMLVVDEATRFKSCCTIEGQHAEQLLTALLQSWIYVFGPPGKVVMDQQVSLMSHESGSEFERLNMQRAPRGTTAGPGSEQHTGTGIVERHVQLMKLTMLKLRAELQRQGFNPQPEELGRESFYSPDSTGILSYEGAGQTDISVFERALRIRQTALAQAQQAVIEDRPAGTSEVEFYREVKDDLGWRGPALLLRLDADEGVAVIQYQGKPYLVALRHIRPFRGIYHVSVPQPEVDDTLNRLMRYVESVTDYKIYLYGWVKDKKDKWVQLPKNKEESNRILQKATVLSEAMTRRTLHGCLFGKALRNLKPPNNTTGILITWINGGRSYAVQEHKSDHHLKLKKITMHPREDVCLLYLYYYNQQTAEEEGNLPRRPTATTSTSTPMQAPSTGTAEMEEENVSKKRDTPESRTVVLAPERKRQKMEFVQKDLEFIKNYYQQSTNKQMVLMDFQNDWRWGSDIMTDATRNFLHYYTENEKKKFGYLFNIAYKTQHEAVACLRTAKIYKVDQEKNNNEDNDIDPALWPQIEEADRNEVKQFVDEKAFKPIHRMQMTDEMVQIDARWVWKWKRLPDRTLKMKSRLCARGCLDQQKSLLTTRSTTATRLSQRILVSTAARKKSLKKKIESWDIAGAFLKGFDFKAIQKALQKMGVSAPTRQVVVYPPMNVWRLASLSSQFQIPPSSLHEYGLLCLKPIYGLNDAPLAWQLSLHSFVEEELGAHRSKLDENCFFFKHPSHNEVDTMDNLESMITTHVDDLAIMADESWLDARYKKFVQKYQKGARQKLPFQHCGCWYAETNDGFSITQKEFAEKLQHAKVPGRADNAKLTAEEVTDFRSVLGALLWITATRLDVVADVSLLQSRVTIAEVKDIKLANGAIDKVKQYSDIGLHYRFFESNDQRIVCIHDASSASKGRHYAQEGILVLLADDRFRNHTIDLEEICDD